MTRPTLVRCRGEGNAARVDERERERKRGGSAYKTFLKEQECLLFSVCVKKKKHVCVCVCVCVCVYAHTDRKGERNMCEGKL